MENEIESRVEASAASSPDERKEQFKGYAIGAAKAGFVGAMVGSPVLANELLDQEDFTNAAKIFAVGAVTLASALVGARMSDGAGKIEKFGWRLGLPSTVMAAGEMYIIDSLNF